MDMKTMAQGLSVEDVEELVTSLEMGKGKSKIEDSLRYFVLVLLGPHLAGPMMDDGWFAADFAMAHQIYGNLRGEQTWMSSVDLLEEVVIGGLYFWGYPKYSRLQVLAKGDAPFYTLFTPRSLLSDFKEKLSETVARLCVGDKLLLLIFAHGDEELDENEVKSGILVGEGDQEGFGVLYASELYSILSPCLTQVTLITSTCFGGAWHHESRTTYSTTNDVETLSVPASNSRAYRGGYFGEAMWYELSRLGFRELEKDVEESHKFKEGICRVQDRLKDLMIFNPKPTISVASEEEWEHHFRKVIQLNEFGDQTHFSFYRGSSSGHENIGGKSRIWSRHVTQGLQDADMHALLSIGSNNETILPSYAIPKNKNWIPGAMSSYFKLDVIGLPSLVDYYIHSMPGLHNLPSNIPTFKLLWKYWRT